VPEDKFLCSELVKVSAGGIAEIGNLELISPQGCVVTIAAAPPIGARVGIRCVECPLGKKTCTECRFRGRVRGLETDPVLGCLLHVEFEGRTWSLDEWQPRHLTNIRVIEE
jgi:hypothetical protein